MHHVCSDFIDSARARLHEAGRCSWHLLMQPDLFFYELARDIGSIGKPGAHASVPMCVCSATNHKFGILVRGLCLHLVSILLKACVEKMYFMTRPT